MEQLTFDFTEETTPLEIQEEKIIYNHGDHVRVVTSRLDSEAYNYYKYYNPDVLKRTGTFLSLVDGSGNRTAYVDYGNNVIQIELHNIRKRE